MRDPGAGARAHHRLERGHQAARGMPHGDLAVVARLVDVGLAVGDDHDLLPVQVPVQRRAAAAVASRRRLRRPPRARRRSDRRARARRAGSAGTPDCCAPPRRSFRSSWLQLRQDRRAAMIVIADAATARIPNAKSNRRCVSASRRATKREIVHEHDEAERVIAVEQGDRADVHVPAAETIDALPSRPRRGAGRRDRRGRDRPAQRSRSAPDTPRSASAASRPRSRRPRP